MKTPAPPVAPGPELAPKLKAPDGLGGSEAAGWPNVGLGGWFCPPVAAPKENLLDCGWGGLAAAAAGVTPKGLLAAAAPPAAARNVNGDEAEAVGAAGSVGFAAPPSWKGEAAAAGAAACPKAGGGF